MKFFSITSAALACLTLVACGSYAGREAGFEVLESDLGVATATNVAVQSGELNGAYTANLTRKFAAEAPARINFAFNSTGPVGATVRGLFGRVLYRHDLADLPNQKGRPV